ncbi:MAG: hypothetical protein QM820_62380 [Minicystis sp.]
MNKNILFLGFITLALAACTSGGTGSSAQAVVLDVRCAADSECPTGFDCETEVEHGTEASYCVSDDSQGTSTGTCPAGYELETEHSETFCKPHGGDGSHGGDDSASSSDDATDGGTGTVTEGGACATSADCAAGLECETEIEGSVTTSICKAHGGT